MSKIFWRISEYANGGENGVAGQQGQSDEERHTMPILKVLADGLVVEFIDQSGGDQ
jgi:hypothetical protein